MSARLLVAAFAMAAATVAAAQDLPPAPAMYLAPAASTSGGSIAVGPDGVLHAAAASYGAGMNQVVTWASCAGDCENEGNWRRVELPVPGAIATEIAVTPRGAPRLLIRATAAAGAGGRDFLYAECGALTGPWAPEGVPEACYDPAGWRIVRVTGNNESSMGDFFEYLLPYRTFALDPEGNPRFIYTDSNYFIEPDHYGAFYMSCDEACTDPRNWTETNLANQRGYTTEQFTRPVLTIGPDGSAHVLAWVYAFDPDGTDLPDDIYYYECAADCADRANWGRVSLINAGGGSYPSPTWDLAIDPDGRPRAAVFVGGGAEIEGIDYSLVYLWCDAACTGDTGWAGAVIYDGGFGEAPDLAIDAAGRPRVAFLTDDGRPVVAACDADCETDESVWNGVIFEEEADMAADRPTAIPFTCDGELWNAMSPRLALGPAGALHVAYDVSVEARCLYREFQRPEITFEFHEIWRGVRIAQPVLAQ